MPRIRLINIRRVLYASLGICLIAASPMTALAATSKKTVNFPESSDQKQSQTINLPSDFDSLNSITTNNGDVSYNINDNQMDITVNNGSPTSSSVVYNADKYRKEATVSEYSDSNNFPDTTKYNDPDGYEGILNLSGSPYVVSGTYTPSSSKTISTKEQSESPDNFPSSLSYNSDGYAGTLNKTGSFQEEVIDGGVFQKDSKTVTSQKTLPSNRSAVYQFKFDGKTYVQLPSGLTSFGKGSSDFTFEGWFYSTSGDTRANYFAKNSAMSNGGVNNLLMGESGSSKYAMSTGDENGSNAGSYVSDETATKKEKVHIVWSVKGNVMSLYRNGQLLKQQSINARADWDDSQAPQLGMDIDGTSLSDFFQGYMYEVRLYNRSLNSTEVTNNYKGSASRTGLLAEYLFNEGSGTVIKDHSGNGNDATVKGNPVWVYSSNTSEPNFPNTVQYDDGDYRGDLSQTNRTSSPKNRMNFDGETYVKLPDKLSSIGDGNSSITIEGWFEATPKDGVNAAVYALNGNTPKYDNNILVGIYSNRQNLDIRPGDTRVNGGTNTIERGKKVHLVWEISGNTAMLYLNGELINTQYIQDRNYTYDTTPQLGMDYDSTDTTSLIPGDFWEGYMYEVRIYNRALSSSEVKDNMNGKVSRSGLKGEYLFNEGSGTTIKDHSGNGNDGTVVGNPIWETYNDDYIQNYSGEAVKYINATYYVTNKTNSFANTYQYEDNDGYRGTLNQDGSASLNEDGLYEQKYSGIAYSATYDNRQYMYTQEYSGTVTSQPVDSRVWRADYSGTAYKGGNDETNFKYSYTVTLDYDTKSIETSTSSNCSYKGVSPVTTTVSNYLPKCVSVSGDANKLYELIYDFKVTGISNAD